MRRRELWPGYSTYTAWQTLLSSTKRQSKDHQVMGELYGSQMSNRFTELMEDIQRMYKKVRGENRCASVWEVGEVCVMCERV